jgi:hypothetical protein
MDPDKDPTNPKDPTRPNPGDPGPPIPDPDDTRRVDPREDPRIPEEDYFSRSLR